MLTLNDGRSELWQWDTGRTVSVDADCSQVHFSNKVFGRSIDVDVVDGVAIIPDILLQTDKDLFAWAFVGTPENGYTKISKVFKVNRRNKPSDYVFTPPEQTTLGEILERFDVLEFVKVPDAIKNAVEDYWEQNPVEIPVESVNGKTGKVELTAKDVGAIDVEIDPTVSAWAKQPQKPAYTAQEVGALPDTTKIPSSLSELSEDTIHRVVTDAEKAAWNAKSNFSGSYNDLTDKPTIPDVPVQSVNGKTGAVQLGASDVGARPATWMPTAQEIGALPATYTLPIATENTLGGVKAAAATEEMTQPVGITAEGKLVTVPVQNFAPLRIVDNDTGKTYIAEIQVTNGKPVCVYDEFTRE